MIIGSQPKFPSFLLTYREINHRKHIGSNYNIVQLVSKFIIQPHNLHQQEKESSFQKVVIHKSPSKRSLFRNLQFYINI